MVRSCEIVEVYLDCVEGWVAAVEVFIQEVYAEAGREHCYTTNKEDSDDGDCGNLAKCFRGQRCWKLYLSSCG